MSTKTCKVKLVRLGGDEILAPREMSSAQLKEWIERIEQINIEVSDLLPVAFTDRQPDTGIEYAALIENLNFEPDDLPMFLSGG